jgi:hypothetical protein
MLNLKLHGLVGILFHFSLHVIVFTPIGHYDRSFLLYSIKLIHIIWVVVPLFFGVVSPFAMLFMVSLSFLAGFCVFEGGVEWNFFLIIMT